MTGGRRTPSRSRADIRLRRLLVMVPWLAAQDGPTVTEVCERFDITPKELHADLDLLTMVGIPPYTPAEYFDLGIVGDRVHAHLTPSLDRPPRFTPAEALGLLVAGQVGAADDPEGALARALAKLAGVLGISASEAVDVELGAVDGDVLAVLRAGVEERRQVRVRHHGQSRAEAIERVVDPWLVTSHAGTWYLVGHDHVRDDERTFRIDRILEAVLLDEPARPSPGDLEAGRPPGEEAPIVTIEVGERSRWVAETYPVESIEQLDGGRLRLALRVGGRGWLERLLLRLGADALVVDGPDELRRAGQEAAERLLARYR